MKSSSVFCTSLALVASAGSAHADIKVPFFMPLSPQQLCGKLTSDCQPTSSTKYVTLKDRVIYRGKPAQYLGRKFTKIYETSPCVAATIDANDVDYLPEHAPYMVSGVLESETRPEFKAKATADIAALVRKAVKDLPDDIKAQAEATLSGEIDTKLTQSISLEYRQYDLNQQFMDDNLESCVSEAKTLEKVITGISVVTVSSDWVSTILSETLSSVEANAGFANLSGEAKAGYFRNKDAALSGKIEPVSVVISVAYRKGTKGWW